MMKHAVCLIACAAALAACNKGTQVNEKNASVAEVVKKVHEAGADEGLIRPGLWQSKVTIDQLDLPGMRADMAQRMKTIMAEKQEHDSETCMTAEDVKRPKEDFFAGKNNQCRYDHFTMGGGKIDAAMRCGGKDSSSLMQMTGTYSPDSYRMQTAMNVQPATGGQGGMSVKMRIEAQRVGECTAKKG